MNVQIDYVFNLVKRQFNEVQDFETLWYLMQHFPSDWKEELLIQTKELIMLKLHNAEKIRVEKFHISASMMKFRVVSDQVLAKIFKYLTPRQLLGSDFHITNNRFHNLILKQPNLKVLETFRLNSTIYVQNRSRKASWINDHIFNFHKNHQWIRIPRIVYDYFFSGIFPTNYKFWKLMVHRLTWSYEKIFGNEDERIRLIQFIFNRVPKERWPDMFQYDVSLLYNYHDSGHDAGRKYRIDMYNGELPQSKYANEEIDLQFLMKDSEFGAVCNSIKRSFFSLTKILIEEYGAPVYEYPLKFDDHSYLFFQTTPLHEAVQHRNINGMKMIEYLLEKGADNMASAHCLIPRSMEFTTRIRKERTENYDILHELFKEPACNPRLDQDSKERECEYAELRVKNIRKILETRNIIPSNQILRDYLEHACSPINEDIEELLKYNLNIRDFEPEDGGTVLHFLAKIWSKLRFNLKSHRQAHKKLISVIPLFIQYGACIDALDNKNKKSSHYLNQSGQYKEHYQDIYDRLTIIQ